MVTGLQLALHSASAETRHELVFAKSLARAPDALNPSLNLISLDLDLPDVDLHDPLSDLRVLYQRVPETPIAIFSANESPALIRGALKAGAAGFSPNRLKTGIIFAAIDIVLKRAQRIQDCTQGRILAMTAPTARDGTCRCRRFHL
jgi:DNA-binding NarL/FixJ family response regulator